jgi:uncharacterized lipoprotein
VTTVRQPVVALVCTALLLAACSSTSEPAAPSDGAAATSATSSSAAPVAPPPPPAPLSDEDQIKESLQAVQDAFNTQNWDAYLEMMCPVQRAKFTGNIMEMVKKTRLENGRSTMKVVSVVVSGDTAKATVEATNETAGTMNLVMPLERSDGWKLCVKDGLGN